MLSNNLNTIDQTKEHRHYIIYKPVGYLSQFVNNQTRRKNKKLLGALHLFPQGIMAIGRLDEKSEGLLLLTTDGKVSEAVRSKQVEKEYYVEVDGIINSAAVQQLLEGVFIKNDGANFKAQAIHSALLTTQEVDKIPYRKVRTDNHGSSSWVTITLNEGKFRQVRKMTAAVGHPTLRLVRVRIGDTFLGSLQPGEIISTENFDI